MFFINASIISWSFFIIMYASETPLSYVPASFAILFFILFTRKNRTTQNCYPQNTSAEHNEITIIPSNEPTGPGYIKKNVSEKIPNGNYSSVILNIDNDESIEVQAYCIKVYGKLIEGDSGRYAKKNVLKLQAEGQLRISDWRCEKNKSIPSEKIHKKLSGGN